MIYTNHNIRSIPCQSKYLEQSSNLWSASQRFFWNKRERKNDWKTGEKM